MVEMLGVLAIIGVLSVGAITGYSKAMMKYKLNQHAQAVNMLINNVLSIKDKLQYKETGETYYGTVLYKMNLLPDGIKYINNTSLHDSWFNGDMWVYYNNDYNIGGIGFQFEPTAQGAEVCRNIVYAAKENSANLYSLVTYKFYNDDDKDDTQEGTIFGDAYCSSKRWCMRFLDLNKIDSLCNSCNEKACRLYVLWK